jgi:hypothetical protein
MMGDKKKLPKGLAEKQEFQRQETVNKVLRAVADIHNEDRKVTISALVEFTGLSRSTFSKSHIRELLVEYGYALGDNAVASAKRRKIGQAKIISEKDRLIAELRVKNAELERECELLRGRLFLTMQKSNK